LNQFTLSYVDKNRKSLLEKYPTFEKFKKDFIVEESLVNELIKKGEAEGVKYDEKGLRTSKEVVYIQLKALMARDIFGNANFYEVINQLNDSYMKALELLKNDEAFKKFKIQN
jgi:carboxyl-terminal processing protease